MMDKDWVDFFKENMTMRNKRFFNVDGIDSHKWWGILRDKKDMFGARDKNDLPDFDIYISDAAVWDMLEDFIRIEVPSRIYKPANIYRDNTLPKEFCYDFDYAIVENSTVGWYVLLHEDNLKVLQKSFAMKLLTI